MKYFIQKAYKIIVSVFGFIINTIGLILSIMGACNTTEIISERGYILFLLIISELFLIGSVIYTIISVMKNHYNRESIESKNIELSKHRDANQTVFENTKTIITSYKDFNDRLNDIRDKHANEMAHIIEVQNELPPDTADKINSLNKSLIENYRTTLMDQYNRFMINTLNSLKSSVEKYMSTKGIDKPIAFAIKQLEHPESYSKIDDNKKNIYTAFRDARTYNSKTRNETWDKVFCIRKNSDFRLSIEKDYYIFNHMNKTLMENGLYHNENENFYEYYNSGVTCTIHSCVGGERVLYGFLSCDALFDEADKKTYGKQLFDYNVANMMMYTAHIIALYLEKFLNMWDECYVIHYSPDLDENSNEYKKHSMCKTMIDHVNRTRYNG